MSDFGKGDFGRGAYGVTPLSDGSRVSVAMSTTTVTFGLAAGGSWTSPALSSGQMAANFNVVIGRPSTAVSAGAMFAALSASATYRTGAISGAARGAQRVTIGARISAALSAGTKFGRRIVGVDRRGAALSAHPLNHGRLIAGASRLSPVVSSSAAAGLVTFVLGALSQVFSVFTAGVKYIRGAEIVSDSKATFVVAAQRIGQSQVIGRTESTAKFFAALRVVGGTNEASQSASLFTGRLVWEPDTAGTDNWAADGASLANWQADTTSPGGWNPSSDQERVWAPCEGTEPPWLTPTPPITT